MLLLPGHWQVPPCFLQCLGWMRSPRTTSQARTSLDVGSVHGKLCSFLGQTSHSYLPLLLLMPCLHGSLSHPLALQPQPLPCITHTPTAPSVGHPGAALETGALLHPQLLPSRREYITPWQAGAGPAPQQEGMRGVQDARKKVRQRSSDEGAPLREGNPGVGFFTRGHSFNRNTGEHFPSLDCP